MRRPGFWLRWSRRDLRRRWVLVAAIALLLAIGNGLYTGLGSLEAWRVESNDASFALTNVHDLRVRLAEGSFAERGALRSLARELPHASSLRRAEERLVVPTQVEAERGAGAVLAPGEVVGVDVSGGGPRIDRAHAEEGRGLRASDAGRPVALLEAGFAEEKELPAAGRLRVAGGEALRWVGQARAPEYFLVTTEGGAFASGVSFAALFVPLDTAERLAGRPGAVNDLVLDVAPGADASALRRELERSIARRLPELGAEVTTTADLAPYRILYEDASNDQQLFDVFALLVLGGAALGAFNLIARVVEAQRREIGVGMALGVEPRTLAVRPLLLGIEIALLGLVLGVGAGLVIGEWLRSVLEAQLPLPRMVALFQPEVFARGAAVGLLLPLAATAYPVWRGLRMTPVEAIRVGFRSAKGGGLAPAVERVRLPGRTPARMPLRNVARTPRRTLMTLLGIGAVIALVVTMAGAVDSFQATFDRSERETLGATPSRLRVDLDGFYARDAAELERIKAAPAVGAVEPRLALAGELLAGGREIEVSLELLDPASRVWRPTISAGSFGQGTRGVVIAEEAADDLDVGVGDTIVVRHPRRAGPAAFATAETPMRIAALHPNPFRTFAYLDPSQAEPMGLAGLANSLAVVPAPGAGKEDVQQQLFGLPAVASAEPVSATTDALDDAMDDFTAVLAVIVAIALVLALLMAFNSTSINADERAREYATMFAFGLPVRSVMRMSIAEGVITGALGTLVGLGLGVAILGWVVEAQVPEVLPELGAVVSLSGASVAAAALAGIGAAALAPLLTLRRLRRMDVPSTLRVVE